MTRIVALVPAHNESSTIGPTIEALLAQTRPLDLIVVSANNCTDDTADVARSYRYPVVVIDVQGNVHRKSEAMNLAWSIYCKNADIVICSDADTKLSPHAVCDWEQEFAARPKLGGSSSKPVMLGTSLLARIQKAEFTKSASISLRRGATNVISGTGCAYRNNALREIAARDDQPDGPWSYASAVEDFYLTYRLREADWRCVVSPTVWCLTGSMPTIKTLWAQRIKWQTGTVQDLLRFGLNALTWREWLTQAMGLLCIVFWILWPTVEIMAVATGQIHFTWLTVTIFPAFFSAITLYEAMKIHDKDRWDIVVALSLFPMFLYTWLMMGWVSASWWRILRRDKSDLWAVQYKAEGI